LKEVAEIVAFDVDNDSKFDLENRFAEPEEILKICSSLVTTTNTDDPCYKEVDHEETRDEETEDENIYEPSSKTRSKTTIVRLAHFSVKEYLISERTQAGSASFYSIDEKIAHAVIAEMSLSCLLQFDRPLVSNSAEFSEKFPLAEYAARYWNEHVLVNDRSATRLALALFLSEEKFRNWTSLYDLDQKFQRVNVSSPNTVGAPIYYAVLTRLFKLVEQLIAFNAATGRQAEVTRINLPGHSTDGEFPLGRKWPGTKQYVSVDGGYLHTALQAASRLGQEDIVKLLIEKGADPNIYGRRSALSDAARSGSKDVVELLLNNGADVHEGLGLEFVGSTELIGAEDDSTQSSQPLPRKEVHKVEEKDGSSTISQRASTAENERITITTTIKAADIRPNFHRQTTALFEASSCGHVDIMKLLLEKGAIVDRRNWQSGRTALFPASFYGREQAVRVLLENGAYVDKTDWDGRTPLYEASCWGQEKIVDLLLKHWASMDKSDEIGRTPLHRASGNGHKAVVNLLLKHGANVNEGAPLMAALRNGQREIARLILENEAKVNMVQEFMEKEPLPTWSHHSTTFKALQDIYSKLYEMVCSSLYMGRVGLRGQVVWKETPLWIASATGCEESVRLLLDRGASVSETGLGEMTPLQIAAEEGHKRVVELLLAAGADKNLQSGNPESPELENEGPRLLLGYEDGSQTSLSLLSLLCEAKATAWAKDDPWRVRLPEILTKEPLPIRAEFIAATKQ
jgi:ankyrin repeat protein